MASARIPRSRRCCTCVLHQGNEWSTTDTYTLHGKGWNLEGDRLSTSCCSIRPRVSSPLAILSIMSFCMPRKSRIPCQYLCNISTDIDLSLSFKLIIDYNPSFGRISSICSCTCVLLEDIILDGVSDVKTALALDVSWADALCPKAIPFITLLDFESTSSNLMCSCFSAHHLACSVVVYTDGCKNIGFGLQGPKGEKRFRSACRCLVMSLKSIDCVDVQYSFGLFWRDVLFSHTSGICL